MQNNYQIPSPEVQLELVSTTTSELESTQKQKPETIGPKSTDKTFLGQFWEKKVAEQAVLRGYSVFTNDYSTGDVDLYIRIGDEAYPFDVKQDTWKYRDNGWQASNVCQVSPGVYPICVNPETGNIRWHKPRGSDGPNCPPGWENIWD